MNKAYLIALVYGSLSFAMRPPQFTYDRNATNNLATLLDRDGFSLMKPEEIQKVLANIKRLIEAGADPNVRPPQLYTPLFFAIEYDPRMIPFLFNYGADPNFINFPKVRPLEFAIERAKSEAAQMLIRGGANVKAVYYGNETPLTLAIRHDMSIIPILLKRGAELNILVRYLPNTKRVLALQPPAIPQPGSLNIDPLGLAIIMGKTEAARLLIEAGANVNQLYQNNITPLMMAVSKNNQPIVHMLLDHGAWVNKNQRNDAKETAFDIAHKKGYLEIEKLLQTQKIP